MRHKQSSAQAARRYAVCAAAFGGLLAAAMLAAETPKVEFRHIVFDAPLDVTPDPNEQLTEAVRQFHATGKNPYNGDPQATAEGKELYNAWCASCHMPDGTGGMGPSLVDDQTQYPRTETDVGMFEAIYGGALGAMQSFRGRLTQDQMLKIVAYINMLRKKR